MLSKKVFALFCIYTGCLCIVLALFIAGMFLDGELDVFMLILLAGGNAIAGLYGMLKGILYIRRKHAKE